VGVRAGALVIDFFTSCWVQRSASFEFGTGDARGNRDHGSRRLHWWRRLTATPPPCGEHPRAASQPIRQQDSRPNPPPHSRGPCLRALKEARHGTFAIGALRIAAKFLFSMRRIGLWPLRGPQERIGKHVASMLIAKLIRGFRAVDALSAGSARTVPTGRPRARRYRPCALGNPGDRLARGPPLINAATRAGANRKALRGPLPAWISLEMSREQPSTGSAGRRPPAGRRGPHDFAR